MHWTSSSSFFVSGWLVFSLVLSFKDSDLVGTGDFSAFFLKNDTKDAFWASVISWLRGTEKRVTFFFGCPGVSDFPDGVSAVLHEGFSALLLGVTGAGDALLGDPSFDFKVWGVVACIEVGEVFAEDGVDGSFLVNAVMGVSFPALLDLLLSSTVSGSSKFTSRFSLGLLIKFQELGTVRSPTPCSSRTCFETYLKNTNYWINKN